MSTQDLDQLDELWERIDKEAMDAKLSQGAVLDLSRLYRGWDAGAQQMARQAFARWLDSTNARKRFDALALIREFSVIEAVPALQRLKTKLEREAGPEPAFELRKVNDVLRALADQRPIQIH